MQSSPGSFHVTVDKTDEVEDVLRELGEVLVLVGVPESTAPRSGKGNINNAALLFIHEHGSPAKNIPARPSLNPGVRDSRSQWEKHLEKAARAALDFDKAGMTRGFHAAGITAVSSVKKTIQAGIPPPIKPSTMAARARHRGGATPRERQKRARQRAAYRGFYERYERGLETSAKAGGVTPLIDLAQMINAVTYVLGKKGKK